MGVEVANYVTLDKSHKSLSSSVKRGAGVGWVLCVCLEAVQTWACFWPSYSGGPESSSRVVHLLWGSQPLTGLLGGCGSFLDSNLGVTRPIALYLIEIS